MTSEEAEAAQLECNKVRQRVLALERENSELRTQLATAQADALRREAVEEELATLKKTAESARVEVASHQIQTSPVSLPQMTDAETSPRPQAQMLERSVGRSPSPPAQLSDFSAPAPPAQRVSQHTGSAMAQPSLKPPAAASSVQQSLRPKRLTESGFLENQATIDRLMGETSRSVMDELRLSRHQRQTRGATQRQTQRAELSEVTGSENRERHRRPERFGEEEETEERLRTLRVEIDRLEGERRRRAHAEAMSGSRRGGNPQLDYPIVVRRDGRRLEAAEQIIRAQRDALDVQTAMNLRLR